MSSKSAPRPEGKSPWSDASKRGRSGALLVTVVVLMVATLIWTLTYTRAIAGRADDGPQPATEMVR